MTQKEILNQIQKNNLTMRQLLNPNEFTLNNAVSELLSENKRLQTLCGEIGHVYDGGYCIYCMKSEN